MTYQVFLKHSAEKELDSLSGSLLTRIRHKLLALETQPRPFGVQKLRGEESYRIRVGDYRILYLIDDAGRRVDIISVRHRREAYR